MLAPVAHPAAVDPAGGTGRPAAGGRSEGRDRVPAPRTLASSLTGHARRPPGRRDRAARRTPLAHPRRGARGRHRAPRRAARPRRAGPPRASGLLRRRGRAREPDQREVRRVPGRLRLLLPVLPLLHRRRRLPPPPARRGARSRARHARGGRDPVLHRGRGARAVGADAHPRDRGRRRGAPRDGPRSGVLVGSAHTRAGRTPLGRGRQAVQPQPRGPACPVPVDREHPHLRRPGRDGTPRHRRGHGAVLRRHPRHGRDARTARRLRVRVGRARTVRSADQLPPAHRHPAR